MNGVVRVLTMLGILLVGASMAHPASAQQGGTATMSQEIVGGELTYSLSGGTMEAITFDVFQTETRITNGSVFLTVEDLRGTHDGWTIEIESTEFEYTGPAPGDHNISAARAVVIPQVPVAQAGQGLEGITAATQAQLETRVPVLSAFEGAGSGRYYQEIQIQLNIPPQQPAGSYTAQMTVTSSAAPGQ